MSSDVTPLTPLHPVTEMVANTTTFVNNSAAEEEFAGVAYRVLVPTIWAIIIVIGAIGNSIVVFTMCKQGGRSMPRSATNCYIINVALADLAFLLLVVPFTSASYVSPEWVFGKTMCKINNYVIYVSLLSTCLTLTAMTIDRYFAIVHPIRSLRTRTPKVAFLICISIWVASMMLCSPYLKFFDLGYHHNTTVCWLDVPHHWHKIITVLIVMFTYVIPLAVIIISYALILHNLWRHKIGHSRHDNRHSTESSEPALGTGDTIAKRRRRVAKMVATVVVLFAISWLPIHVFSLYFVFHDHVEKTKALYDFKILAHTLSYTNSCVNPFVYSIMGDGFRKAFRESLESCTGAASKKPQRYGTSYCPRRVTTTAETGLNGD